MLKVDMALILTVVCPPTDQLLIPSLKNLNFSSQTKSHHFKTQQIQIRAM